MITFKQFLLETKTGVKNFDNIISTIDMLYKGKFHYEFETLSTGQKVLWLIQKKYNIRDYSKIMDYLEKFGYKKRLQRNSTRETMDALTKQTHMDMGLETVRIIVDS